MEDQNLLKMVEEAYKPHKNSVRHGDTVSDKDVPIIKKSSSHDILLDLEGQIVRLKHALESWREVVLPIHSVLLWERNWHPAAIAGGTSFIFLSLWLLDPSVLTAVAILGLTITLSDYLVPTIASTIFKSETWTSSKEIQYSDFCTNIIVYKAKIAISCASFYLMRTTRPKLFYGCTIVTLVLLAWIGNNLNNLFLTYLLVTVLLLIPGMEHHGILKKYGNALTSKITECAKLKTAQFKKE